MNFLIAEDNVRLRRMLRRIVGKASDLFYECGNGVEAVAAYLEYKPDWVLMDIKMPEMDGITAAVSILALDPQARIAIVTGFDDPLLRREAQNAGARYFFAKDDLTVIRRVIENSGGR